MLLVLFLLSPLLPSGYSADFSVTQPIRLTQKNIEKSAHFILPQLRKILPPKKSVQLRFDKERGHLIRAGVPVLARNLNEISEFQIHYSTQTSKMKRISLLGLLFINLHEMGHYLGKKADTRYFKVHEGDADYFAAAHFFAVVERDWVHTAHEELTPWRESVFPDVFQLCELHAANPEKCRVAFFVAQEAMRFEEGSKVNQAVIFTRSFKMNLLT